MSRDRTSAAFNLLAAVLLGLTALMCMCYTVLFLTPIQAGPYGVQPKPMVKLPTPTPTWAPPLTWTSPSPDIPTETPTPFATFTPEATNTPRNSITPAPTRTKTVTPGPSPIKPPDGTAATRSPEVTATPSSTPVPAVIEAEWPTRMEIGRSDSIRVSLIRTPGQAFVPTIEKIGHTAIAATPIPVGTPEASVEKAFGPDYEACATASLVGTAFEIQSMPAECRLVDQPQTTWEWNIIPREPGAQVVNVSLDVKWRPIRGDRPIREYQVWRSRLDIYVEKPLIATGQLRVVDIGALFFGLVLSAPWLYDKTKLLYLGKKRVGSKRVALHTYLCEHFSLEELRTLCFGLDIDFESLPGEGKEAKARELVLYLERRGETDRLVVAFRRGRRD